MDLSENIEEGLHRRELCHIAQMNVHLIELALLESGGQLLVVPFGPDLLEEFPVLQELWNDLAPCLLPVLYQLVALLLEVLPMRYYGRVCLLPLRLPCFL